MFFIAGRGRSGTTLLRSMLNAHPGISVAPEGMFIMYLYNRYRAGAWDDRRIARFHRDLWLERRMQRWHLDRDDLLRVLLQHGGKADFGRLCEEVYASYAVTDGCPAGTLLGDKNPGYSLFFDQLHDILPEARFIYMVRDPRDNILSFQKVRFDANDTATLAYRWKYFNDALLDAQRRWPSLFILLRYEDLVQNPVEELSHICKFLGTDYDPCMLDFQAAQTKNIAQWHSNLNRPITTQHAGKWKDEMAAPEAALVEAICATTARSLGYDMPARQSRGFNRVRIAKGAVVARILTSLERVVFRIPLKARIWIINAYRRATGALSSNP